MLLYNWINPSRFLYIIWWESHGSWVNKLRTRGARQQPFGWAVDRRRRRGIWSTQKTFNWNTRQDSPAGCCQNPPHHHHHHHPHAPQRLGPTHRFATSVKSCRHHSSRGMVGDVTRNSPFSIKMFSVFTAPSPLTRRPVVKLTQVKWWPVASHSQIHKQKPKSTASNVRREDRFYFYNDW